MLVKGSLSVLLVILLATGFHIAETLSKDRLLNRSNGDMRRFAQLLLQAGVHREPVCVPSAEANALLLLMRAILVVETHASSSIERVVETFAIRGAAFLGWPLPDLSIGPGQIRPSTAIKALRSIELAEAGPEITISQVALRLLQPCGSEVIGVNVLSWIAKRNNVDHRDLTKQEIFTIAGRYNADGDGDGLQGALAVSLYQRLVFHTYQELRFRTLSQITELPTFGYPLPRSD